MKDDKKNEIKAIVAYLLFIIFCIAVIIGCYALKMYINVGLFKYFFNL